MVGAELKNTDSEKKINHPRRKCLDYISAALSLKQSKQNDLLAANCSKNFLIRVSLLFLSLSLALPWLWSLCLHIHINENNI